MMIAQEGEWELLIETLLDKSSVLALWNSECSKETF